MVAASDPGRVIVRGAMANAVGLLGRLGGRLVFLVVAARLYGANLFGAFVLAVAVIELAVSIGGLATKKTLFPLLDREIEASHPRRLGHVVLDAALPVAAVSLLLAIVIAVGATLFAPPDTATALIGIAPMIAGQALLDLFLAAARWHDKIRYEVVARSLIEPWALAAAASAAFFLGWGPWGLAAGYWCGTLAALGYAVVGAARLYAGFDLRRYRPQAETSRAILRSAGSNSLSDLLNALYARVDVYLVGALLGTSATGVYGMVRQLTTPLRQARQSFDGLLIPAVSRTIGQSGAAGASEALASAARLMLVIQLPLIVAMIAIGRPLLDWMGPGFGAGYWPLIFLAAAEVLQSALGIGDLVFVYQKPRIGLYLTLIGAAVGIAAALVLIPRFGIAGAAIAMLLASGLRSMLRFAVLALTFRIPIPHAHVGGPLFAAGLALLPSLAIDQPLVRLIAGLAVYGVMLAAWLKATGQRLMLSGFASIRRAGEAL